jgi:hypothetical protein
MISNYLLSAWGRVDEKESDRDYLLSLFSMTTYLERELENYLTPISWKDGQPKINSSQL